MKKLFALVLTLLLSVTLCACPAEEVAVISTENLTSATLKTKAVHITAGKIEPGMTVKDILVEVTMDGQPIPCRVVLTGLSNEGYWEMAEDEKVGDPVFVRLDVFYSLPKGYDVDNIDVTMECDGGEYDGTGSISSDAEGNVEAWSHAIYGMPEETTPETEPQPTETEPQPTETEPQPTETEPQPTETEPQEPTEPPVQSHTHTWVEQPTVYVSCTADSTKTYKCSCGETKTETIPAPGHDWKEGAMTPPTCTRVGSQTMTCSRCGTGFINEFPATGHSWSEWISENGRQHIRTCSTCGEEERANHNIPSGSVTCTDCGEDIIN